MISFASGNSLLSYLGARSSQGLKPAGADAGAAIPADANAKAAASATSQASLKVAGSRHHAAVAGRSLDKQQATLAADLRAAMSQAKVKLAGTVEFSVSTDGKVDIKGSATDRAAMTAFLKADTSKPGLADRIATQAQDALKLSATIQQSAAISQAARYAGRSGGVMSLYNSLMQQSSTSTAVFTLGATSSSLSYPGSLAAKA